MTKLDRRDFLRGTTVLGSVALGMQGLVARGALAAPEARASRMKSDVKGAYGPLMPKAAKNTGETLLELPEGFEYTVFGRTGSLMQDGRPTPGAHDGMAAFKVGDEVRLVRNHEVRTRRAGNPVAIATPSYNPLSGGGTTTLVVDPKTRELKNSWVSIAGTNTNCAGGPTPWGSWITCEETTLGANVGFPVGHGYCFEVPADANGPVTPQPIKGMGRFVHEAVAIDPDTGIVYLTEDQGTSGFYRYIPNKPGKLLEGGKLQMLAIKDLPNYDTRREQEVGEQLDAVWVDITNPDPANADVVPLAVANQGFAQGAAIFSRLEGAWYGDKSIFFNATSGGDAELGQIWQYEPRKGKDGKLTLIFESPSGAVLDSPDNITVSPRGGLVICEDGDEDQYLRGLNEKGEIFDFAKNIVPNFTDREFAGACYSPDSDTLFVNIQTPGITFAIWGPWEKGVL